MLILHSQVQTYKVVIRSIVMAIVLSVLQHQAITYLMVDVVLRINTTMVHHVLILTLLLILIAMNFKISVQVVLLVLYKMISVVATSTGMVFYVKPFCQIVKT